MDKYIIPKETIINKYRFPEINYPKYTSQLMNWANQNAQSTRPKNVGQMSELFPEFQHSSKDISLEGWEKWYTERYPDAIDNATDRLYDMLLKMKEAMNDINRDLVKTYVRDLIINKTYMGLFYQQVVLQSIADRNITSEVHENFKYNGEKVNKNWRLANPEEEAKGIDGFVNGKPYQIKPTTYKIMERLPEQINVAIAYYKTNSKGDLIIEIEE